MDRGLCSDRRKADLSLASLINGYIAEVHSKVKKDYCKVDKINDENVVDVSADDLCSDATDVSGDDQQQEGKACSLSCSCSVRFHHIDRP